MDLSSVWENYGKLKTDFCRVPHENSDFPLVFCMFGMKTASYLCVWPNRWSLTEL